MRIAFVASAVAVTLVMGSPARADADPVESDLILASVPDVPDASASFARAIQEEVTAALDPSLFLDPNEGETEMLMAQDLDSLRVEATGSLAAAAEVPVADQVGLRSATDLLP
jgi:hypothetical protein